MRKHVSTCYIACLFLFSVGAFAGTRFQANTTLAAETANNTSAADSFLTQTNGNIAGSNISKLPTRTLLYAGSATKIYAHFVPWFGFGDHMKIGYTSNDVLQVQKQVNDMVSRGLDGAVIDWYGRGTFTRNFTFYDQASQELMHQAELHPGFTFAIMYDTGALKACAGTLGCDVTQTMIDDLNYANLTYENSPAYVISSGRPVVYLFGEEAYAIDWTRVSASVAGNPLLIFRNPGAFSKTQSNGGFAWIAPETVSLTDPMALLYLDNYDRTAFAHATAYSTSSGYKGFNDTLALWGSNRIINQQCGQTWLQSMAEAGKFYSATKQMLGLQLVTWNDYEEGSELETGIDNCVTVSVSVSGTVANWSITGQQNTIDHFSLFVSQDGQNLMWLADATAATRTIDLAQFSLNSGNYIVFVKAVGKPSLTNKMSVGVLLTVPNQSPVAALTVTPASGNGPLTVNASAAGSSDVDGTIASTTISFGDGSASVSAASAAHIYNAAGTYTVTATVTDNLGATASQSAALTVLGSNKPPVAALSVTPATAYAPAVVSASTAASTDPDGAVASSRISFGDGFSASGPAASHTYAAGGVYTLTATVTDNLGASSSTTTTVTVKAPEIIISSPTAGSGLAPLSMASPIHVVAAGFSGNPVTTMQVLVDGNPSYTINSASVNTNVPAAPGVHTLIVKGVDSAGGSFSKTVQVSVPNQPPVAALGLNTTSILVGASLSASTAGSSDPDGTVASTQINFGDGTAVVPGTTAVHQYKLAGTYTVTATVTDNLGASATASKTLTVKPQFVTIASPVVTTTTSTTVRVTGSAFSGYPVVATQVYLDGVLKYQTAGSTADTLLNLSLGTHQICVQGWDQSVATFKAFATVTRK